MVFVRAALNVVVLFAIVFFSAYEKKAPLNRREIQCFHMNLAEKCAFACGVYAAVDLSVSGAASAFQRFQLVNSMQDFLSCFGYER